MVRSTWWVFVVAAFAGLSMPTAGAQPGPIREAVKIAVRPGSIDVDRHVIIFPRGRPGTITWELETNGDFEFDPDGNGRGVVVYELNGPTDRPNKADEGKAKRQFDCKVVAGSNRLRFECANLNTEPGRYWYDIRLKHRRDGSKRSIDPIIVNL